MHTYVITFSSVALRDGWVEIEAKNEAIVRAWANKEYQRWSTTYPIEDFGPETRALFPLGCLGGTTLHYEEASHV